MSQPKRHEKILMENNNKLHTILTAVDDAETGYFVEVQFLHLKEKNRTNNFPFLSRNQKNFRIDVSNAYMNKKLKRKFLFIFVHLFLGQKDDLSAIL